METDMPSIDDYGPSEVAGLGELQEGVGFGFGPGEDFVALG